MGCWNETCALTRTPISAGADVVVLTAINGPRHKTSGSFATSLLFGLPIQGKYDDYGGVEDLVKPAQLELINKAFEASGFYRQVSGTRSYGGGESRFIASSKDTLWGMSHELKHLFYDDCSATMADASSLSHEAHEKLAPAYKRCDEALANLGAELGKAEFGPSLDDVNQGILDLVAKHFGEHRKWAAFYALRNNGLFASQSLIFMHKVAYDALVQEMGQRKVYYYGDKARTPMREFLKERLTAWKSKFKEQLAQATEREKRFAEAGLKSEDEDRISALLYRMLLSSSKDDYLMPMSTMWMAPEVPLIGHFWGGATLDEVEAHFTEDELLDFFVFQWARSYLRTDFQPASSGSQNTETALLDKTMRATMKALKADGNSGVDFYGCIHR